MACRRRILLTVAAGLGLLVTHGLPRSAPVAADGTDTDAVTTTITGDGPEEARSPDPAPDVLPTESPTTVPTESPTAVPTETPTAVPTDAPAGVPTDAATETAVATEQATAPPEPPTAPPSRTVSPGGSPTLPDTVSTEVPPVTRTATTPIPAGPDPGLVLVAVDARSTDRAVAPGGTAAYRFVVTNRNPGAVRVTLTAITDGSGWTVVLCDPDGPCRLVAPVTLEPGESTEVSVQVTAPATAEDGEQVTTVLTVTTVEAIDPR